MQNKSGLRNFPSAQKRREFLEKNLDIKLDNIGSFSFPEEAAIGRNIENLIGATQIPLGVAGPLLIHQFVIATPDSIRGKQSSSENIPTQIASSKTPRNDKTFYIPLATTEGALVASVSRGCKAITESSGAEVRVELVGATRGSVFVTQGIRQTDKVQQWIKDSFAKIAKIAESTSSHLKLLKIEVNPVGKNLFLRFSYDSQDAMGLNMVTIANTEVAKFLEKNLRIKCVSVAGNFDIDKKPAWLNFILGRGKKVWAEVILKKEVVRDVLKTTPKAIAEVVYRKCQIGSAMSGSLGFNSHYANVVAAIFAATGQDLAQVVEGSLGITTAEVLKDGNLYFSIYLPALMCGTVGGGTHLPTQQEALKIMKVSSVQGVPSALEYSMVVGTAVLAGELSLIASLAEGSLAKAHQKLGRKNEG